MLIITKIRDVKSPKRWNPSDAWIDFFVPNNLKELLEAENCVYTPKEYIENQKEMKEKYFNLETWEITIPSWYGLLIPSWIKIAFTKWNELIRFWYSWVSDFPEINEKITEALIFFNKSWIATKKWLLIWAQVVDEWYRWEVHLHLINPTKFDVKISAWDKITQWIPVMPIQLEIKELNKNIYEKIFNNTERWEWWFWSTWTK